MTDFDTINTLEKTLGLGEFWGAEKRRRTNFTSEFPQLYSRATN